MRWHDVNKDLPPIGVEVLCMENDGTPWLDFRNQHGWGAHPYNGEYYRWWMYIPRKPR